jgi:hypothetical protein
VRRRRGGCNFVLKSTNAWAGSVVVIERSCDAEWREFGLVRPAG